MILHEEITAQCVPIGNELLIEFFRKLSRLANAKQIYNPRKSSGTSVV